MTAVSIDPCPSAETEIDANWRTAFNLTDASDVRLQAQVATGVVGAKLVLKASLDGGTTWENLSAGGTGPTVRVYTDGYNRGTSLNVRADFKADVLLSIFVRGGDDVSPLVLGNVGALVYVRSEEGSIIEVLELCAIPAATEMVDVGQPPFDGAISSLVAYLSTTPWWDTNYHNIITTGGNPAYLDSTRVWNGHDALTGYIESGGAVLRTYISMYNDNFPSYGPPNYDCPDMIAYTVCEFEAGANIGTAGAPYATPLLDATSGLIICALTGMGGMYSALCIRNDHLFLDYTSDIDNGTHEQVIDLGLFDSIIGGQGVVAITLRTKRTSTTTKELTLYVNEPCADPTLIATMSATCDETEYDYFLADFYDTFYDNDFGAPTTVWWWQVATDEDPTLFGLTP